VIGYAITMNMWSKFALRDLAIVATAALVWRYAAALSAGFGPASDLAGVVAGFLVGLSGFVLHEWGHVLGAVAVGAVVHPNTRLNSGFLFSFDTRTSTLRQFLVMSVGGFVVTGALLLVVYRVLPEPLFATRVARGLALFLASLTVLLEFPLVAVALLTGRAPAQAAVLDPPPGTPPHPARQ
jgi:hypothetical protein